MSTTDKVKKGFNSFLEGIANALVIPAEDLEQKESSRPSSGPVFDRAKVLLCQIYDLIKYLGIG